MTLISLEPSPQKARLGEEVGERIEQWLGGYGVSLRLDASIDGITRKDGAYKVSVENGEQVAADTVLFGTGVSPRTELAEGPGSR